MNKKLIYGGAVVLTLILLALAILTIPQESITITEQPAQLISYTPFP